MIFGQMAQSEKHLDMAIRMISEGSSDFTQGSMRIMAHPGAIATTSHLGSGTMEYGGFPESGYWSP